VWFVFLQMKHLRMASFMVAAQAANHEVSLCSVSLCVMCHVVAMMNIKQTRTRVVITHCRHHHWCNGTADVTMMMTVSDPR